MRQFLGPVKPNHSDRTWLFNVVAVPCSTQLIVSLREIVIYRYYEMDFNQLSVNFVAYNLN